MKTLLYLDDLRNPFLNKKKNQAGLNIEWVRNFYEFIEWIKKYDLPFAISFDHDLGFQNTTVFSDPNEEETGYDCAKWLVDYCIDNNKELPLIYVHSANPVGAENIQKLFSNFRKHIYSVG